MRLMRQYLWLVCVVNSCHERFFICKDKNLLSHAAARSTCLLEHLMAVQAEISFGVLGYIRIQLALVLLHCLTIAFLSLAHPLLRLFLPAGRPRSHARRCPSGVYSAGSAGAEGQVWCRCLWRLIGVVYHQVMGTAAGAVLPWGASWQPFLPCIFVFGSWALWACFLACLPL